MNLFLLTVTVFSFFLRSLCQQCPALYLRYSKEHSYCKSANSTCQVYHHGVTAAERKQILDLHNRYRSKVAMGREKQAGGLPQAADMLQMVWDRELAAVAQKRAEQCIYAHDCSNCRRVENFPVGQNIAYREMQCWGSQICPLNSVPDWSDVIKMFYDEVSDFSKNYVKSAKFPPGTEIGHFTQVVWAKTWRIGCGFVAFKKGNGYRQLYVCNYGPTGNIMNNPMYKVGPPCSACPLNSCCGKSCGRAGYEGLCKINRRNQAPEYKLEEHYVFYCDFRTSEGDCSSSVAGAQKWKYRKTLGGSFAEIVLNGGETSTLRLQNTIKPKQHFCLSVQYRSGPDVDGQPSNNKAIITFEMPNSPGRTMDLPNPPDKQQYFIYNINLGWNYDTKVSFTFSVPKGASAQFFDIHLVTAKKGKCG